jgi:hypothetical protein
LASIRFENGATFVAKDSRPPYASFSWRGKIMAKPHRVLKKANHGSRPANAKARKAKRRKVKT